MSLTQVGTDTWMAADQAGSNNKEFDAYNGGLNSTVAPLANTWNPAYQAINTLNAALDRGPTATGHLRRGEELAARRSALPPRAELLHARADSSATSRCTLHENKGVVAERRARPGGGRVQGDHRRSRHGGQPAPGDAGRLRSRDEGRRADAALARSISRARISRTRRASRPTSTAALADAKAVINSGTYTLEPVFADLWCVARAADPGRTGYCENTGYNQNHKEFIFTVQFSYDLTTQRRRRRQRVQLPAPRLPQPVRQQRHLASARRAT